MQIVEFLLENRDFDDFLRPKDHEKEEEGDKIFRDEFIVVREQRLYLGT